MEKAMKRWDLVLSNPGGTANTDMAHGTGRGDGSGMANGKGCGAGLGGLIDGGGTGPNVPANIPCGTVLEVSVLEEPCQDVGASR